MYSQFYLSYPLSLKFRMKTNISWNKGPISLGNAAVGQMTAAAAGTLPAGTLLGYYVAAGRELYLPQFFYRETASLGGTQEPQKPLGECVCY